MVSMSGSLTRDIKLEHDDATSLPQKNPLEKAVSETVGHLLYWMHRFRIKLPGTAVVVFVTTARSTKVLATSEGKVIDANASYQVKLGYLSKGAVFIFGGKRVI